MIENMEAMFESFYILFIPPITNIVKSQRLMNSLEMIRSRLFFLLLFGLSSKTLEKSIDQLLELFSSTDEQFSFFDVSSHFKLKHAINDLCK